MGQLVTKVLVSHESPLPPCFGLAVIAPSRGVESPVPTGVHTLAWTAVDKCCENPQKKKLVAFGVDKTNSSGVFSFFPPFFLRSFSHF